MKLGVLKEHWPGERRVAIIPASVPLLKKAGIDVLVESGAGASAGFPDAQYAEKGAEVRNEADGIIASSDIIAAVRGTAALGMRSLPLREGQVLIGFLDPLGGGEQVRHLIDSGVTALAMELIPRITRAQSMDALSSQASIAGYKAVLVAANMLPRLFPMLTTAAGTITPAKVLVIGAGVAGLQAIATAKRLGSVVSAYDVRPAVKEQVQSLGARFVELALDTTAAEGQGGYAAAQSAEFYAKQQELLGQVVAQHDVVVTTAAVPGKQSPVLIRAEDARRMAPGSVIVDIAAERGGNCELTRADETTVENGVTITGPTNLPSEVPYHASQVYSRHIVSLLQHLVKDGQLVFDAEDEITRDTTVCRGRDIISPRMQQLMASA